MCFVIIYLFNIFALFCAYCTVNLPGCGKRFTIYSLYIPYNFVVYLTNILLYSSAYSRCIFVIYRVIDYVSYRGVRARSNGMLCNVVKVRLLQCFVGFGVLRRLARAVDRRVSINIRMDYVCGLHIGGKQSSGGDASLSVSDKFSLNNELRRLIVRYVL